ncbi:hypothetical protein N7456_000665 [Penicillium angulare]|uniref:Uncharacterized protein n=1 Tax=Penicillium angulare TaxID=116970 RepID=A0A9W9GCZ6_9EURO|nr:hypothetical protein N7456_000665 [Penicillium angulare]
MVPETSLLQVTQPNLAVSFNLSPSYFPLSEVSRHTRRASNDVHDAYDPSTFTNFPRQPQQPSLPRPSSSHSADFRPSSPTGSQRTLRRTRRHPDSDQLGHRRAFSLDQTRQPAYHPPAQSRSRLPTSHRDPERGLTSLRPAHSEAQTDENGSTVDDPYQLLNTSYWPLRTTGVSSRTASAILFALEDAIRRPIPFTFDWEEVNASMSDMVGVAGPAGPMGNGRVQNGASRAPPAPMQVPTQPPSGVRTPTDIMRQRRDREARRKAEQDARDREQEDLERLQLEQEQAAVIQAQARAQAQQQLTANANAGAGTASDSVSQRRARPQRVPRDPETQFDVPAPGTAPGAATNFRATAPAAQIGGRSDYPNQPHPSLSQPQLGSGIPQGRPQSATATGTGGPSGASGFSKPAQAPGQQGTLQQPQRVSFPHAFERWETLSSHWEGLTSYWVRKMEENKDDVQSDPISKQLARQITDLSAAGANLFHAVVELQRLRASSERKFQRWFFDTRSEQERAKEVQADLERQLKSERQGRADAFAAAQTSEKDKSRAEDLLREMRRELQISKEEARRAWEELGRREQEERDRTNSLRNGEPTLVGGVQVVPMVTGASNRNTRPPTREGTYTGGPPATNYQAEPDPVTAQQYYDEAPMSPTGSDPFIEPQKAQPTTNPGSSKAPYTEPVYAHENPAPYPNPTTSEPDQVSYVGSSDAGDEEYGYHQDHPQAGQGYGYPAPLSEASDEYDNQGEHQQYVTDGAYTTATTSAPVHAPYPPPTADYSGSDWGANSGWESVTPRHRHPTRLSDVLEEDEPSRTSPSRASQASRSMH